MIHSIVGYHGEWLENVNNYFLIKVDDWAKIDPYKRGSILIVSRRNPPNPATLTTRIIQIYRKKYTEYWKMIMNRIWRKNNGPLHQRINDLRVFLTPQFRRDIIWQKLFQNFTIENMNLIHRRFLDYIDRRYDFAMRQLDP